MTAGFIMICIFLRKKQNGADRFVLLRSCVVIDRKIGGRRGAVINGLTTERATFRLSGDGFPGVRDTTQAPRALSRERSFERRQVNFPSAVSYGTPANRNFFRVSRKTQPSIAVHNPRTIKNSERIVSHHNHFAKIASSSARPFASHTSDPNVCFSKI